ncbi:MAG: hypothetical protein QUS09_03895 [Methanotrichaceae archaeon]|nr:hypothetical protein [Methanotrichaceae archaeon]
MHKLQDSKAAKFSDMILKVADNVAGEAKEGGFLGFGGQQVSNEERQAISSIHNALGKLVYRRSS